MLIPPHSNIHKILSGRTEYKHSFFNWGIGTIAYNIDKAWSNHLNHKARFLRAKPTKSAYDIKSYTLTLNIIVCSKLVYRLVVHKRL